MKDTQLFDSVVFLTASDWHSELRSNRYHYASRFSKIFPVLFIQADLKEAAFKFEETEIKNLTILHVFSQFGEMQSVLLEKAFFEKNIKTPLFWVYNVRFFQFLKKWENAFIVYHATEDYIMSKDKRYKKWGISFDLYYNLINILKITDLLVSVSEGVEGGFLKKLKYQGNKILVTNGCDFQFYRTELKNLVSANKQSNIIFYQGNITAERLNYELLQKLALKMSDWQFWFCGKVIFNESAWRKFINLKNVKYLGNLSSEEVRAKAHQSTVGIIPFNEREFITQYSLPLKAFEYVACGLPVVSIPIRSLMPYEKLFKFAKTVDEFEKEIRMVAITRYEEEAIRYRYEIASQQDYDVKFEMVVSEIELLLKSKKRNLSTKVDFVKPPSILQVWILLKAIKKCIKDFLCYFNIDSVKQKVSMFF